jgi:hypothetical protein
MIFIDFRFGFCIFFSSVVCFCFHHSSWVAKLLAFVSPLSFCLMCASLWTLLKMIAMLSSMPLFHELLCFVFLYYATFVLLEYCHVFHVSIVSLLYCCDFLDLMCGSLWTLLKVLIILEFCSIVHLVMIVYSTCITLNIFANVK